MRSRVERPANRRRLGGAVDRPRAVPTVSAAVGPVGLCRAANAESGVIIGAFNPVAKARGLFETYLEAGGTGPRLLIRRIWLGTVSPTIMDELAAPYRLAGASYLPDDPDAELVVAVPIRSRLPSD